MARNKRELAKELIEVLKNEINQGTKISKITLQNHILIEDGREVGYDLGVALDIDENGHIVKDYLLDNDSLLYSFNSLFEKDITFNYLISKLRRNFSYDIAKRDIECNLY